MPQPPKPFTVLQGEKKSHRTKAELKQRQESEEAVLTGVKMKESQECKNNTIAHKEFLRVKKLLANIEKNDAIYERVINRYCIITAECITLEEERAHSKAFLELMEEKFDNMDSEDDRLMVSFAREINNYSKQISRIDTILQQKRKMLFDIEKENVMTIAAALRTIPKTEKPKSNPLLEALGD